MRMRLCVAGLELIVFFRVILKVPTLESLYGLVDLMTRLKLNQLQLYMEHTFAYADHR